MSNEPCLEPENTGCIGNDGRSRDGSRGIRGAKYVLCHGSEAVDDAVDCCVEIVDSDVSEGGVKVSIEERG